MKRQVARLDPQARLAAQEQMRFRAWLGCRRWPLRADDWYVAVIDAANGRREQLRTDVCQIDLTWAEKEAAFDPARRHDLAVELAAQRERRIEIERWEPDEDNDELVDFVVAMTKSTKDANGWTVPGEYFVVWRDYVEDYPDYPVQQDFLSEILPHRDDQEWLRAHWMAPRS